MALAEAAVVVVAAVVAVVVVAEVAAAVAAAAAAVAVAVVAVAVEASAKQPRKGTCQAVAEDTCLTCSQAGLYTFSSKALCFEDCPGLRT